MEKIIADFTNDYPLSASMAKEVAELPNLPNEIAIWISLNVSILMAKLKRGYFNKYMRNSNTVLPIKVIDMFGKNYLLNVKNVATEIWEKTGEYELLKKLEVLKPDNFVVKLIEKFCD